MRHIDKPTAGNRVSSVSNQPDNEVSAYMQDPANFSEGKSCLAWLLDGENSRTNRANAIESARILSTVLDLSQLSVVITDPAGRIVYANRGFSERSGLAPEELADRMLEQVDSDNMRRHKNKKMWHALRTGGSWEGELLCQRQDGEMAVEHARVMPIRDMRGELSHSVSLREDITREKAILDAMRQSEGLYRALVDNIQLGVIMMDKEFIVRMANVGFERMLGKSSGEVEGEKCFHAYGRNEPCLGHCPGVEAMRTGSGAETRVQLKQENGESLWLHISAFPQFGAAGEINGVIEVVADVTAQVEAEDRQRRTASVFDNTNDGVLITAPDGRILEVNQAFTRLTGYAPKEAIGNYANMLKSGLHDTHFYQAMWNAILTHDNWEGEIYNRRKDGSIFLESLAIRAVRDDLGQLQHYVGVFSDITHIRETQNRLESLAHYDALTSLPNRVLFADRMNQALAQSLRHKSLMAVGYLDLDMFKPINDTHGHHVGDKLLVEIAHRLKDCVRSGDTVARLGGDEFALLLVDLENVEESTQVLIRMLSSIAAPVLIGNLSLGVSASIGITLYPLDNSDADTLLRHADQAMYTAKQSGRNNFVIFDAEQDRLARSRRELLTGVRLALDRHEFVLYYQPKINMRLGKVVGVEALIRWRHPGLGLLTPAHFLTAIENSDLSVQVDRWVIGAAIRQMSEWASKGLSMPVSVNITARLMHQPNLDVWLQEEFDKYPNVPHSWLELEILETAALEDIAIVSKAIESCGRIGVSFALDDFGTGYSSLTYLKRLPTTALKIDRTFIANMLDDMEDLAIVEGVLGLAAAFNLKVVAEGVESASQGNMLVQYGCDVAQGFGLALPMQAAKLEEWLSTFQLGYEWSLSTMPLQREDLPLLSAELAHRRWIDQVLAAEENSAAAAHINLDIHGCGFGRWYDRRGREKYGFLDEYVSIHPIHIAMHETALQLLAAAAMGESAKMREHRRRLLELQDMLIAKLDDLRVAITLLKKEAGDQY
jgi:diguanylate cyclase (GGDEF)-like protein/PAS domain S-box-containing protein